MDGRTRTATILRLIVQLILIIEIKLESRKKLVNNALENHTLKRVIEDGAYDSNRNFRYLYDANINMNLSPPLFWFKGITRFCRK
jgi:hypothetical protein